MPVPVRQSSIIRLFLCKRFKSRKECAVQHQEETKKAADFPREQYSVVLIYLADSILVYRKKLLQCYTININCI